MDVTSFEQSYMLIWSSFLTACIFEISPAWPLKDKISMSIFCFCEEEGISHVSVKDQNKHKVDDMVQVLECSQLIPDTILVL